MVLITPGLHHIQGEYYLKDLLITFVPRMDRIETTIVLLNDVMLIIQLCIVIGLAILILVMSNKGNSIKDILDLKHLMKGYSKLEKKGNKTMKLNKLRNNDLNYSNNNNQSHNIYNEKQQYSDDMEEEIQYERKGKPKKNKQEILVNF